MLLLSNFLFAIYVSCSACFGQDAKIYVIVDGKTITDPASLLSNVAFLSEASVAKEMSLDDSQTREMNALLNETRGMPSSVFFSIPAPPLETRRLLKEGILQERENRIKDILDPNQRERLQQIIYQIEVSRAGLGNAIVEGFLGRDVGIEDFEKHGLTIILDALQIEVNNAKSKLLKSSQQEILEELSEAQRQMFPNVVGRRFHFRETAKERILRKRNEESLLVRKLPDPESLLEVCFFLELGCVCEELNISVDPIQIRKLRRQFPRSESDGSGFKSAISSIISRDQIARLKQIGYQWEIVKIGLGSAIANGFLGKALGLTEDARQALQGKLSAIDMTAEQGILQLETAARDRFIAELTPRQREKASQLIGKPFSYRE